MAQQSGNAGKTASKQSRGQSQSHSESTLGGMQEQMRGGMEQAQHFVAERPMASAGMCFALGIGVGLLLSMTMGGAPTRRENMFERVGRTVMDSLRDSLPEQMTSRWS